MKRNVAVAIALATLCGACSSSAYDTLASPASATATGTGTETFSSFLSVGGQSVHTFPVVQTGSIAVTVTVVTPAAVVGVGVGTPNTSGAGCNLTSAIEASAAIVDPITGATTPQLTVPADVGRYCVQVFDSGQLGGVGRTFQVTIAHS
jgi:hypothetical protein